MATAPGQYPYQPNWFERHWKLLAALGVAFIFLIVGGFVSGVIALLGHSDAAQMAVAKAQKSPALIQKIGEPMQRGFLVLGSVNLQNSSGSANLSVPISGPKGKATLYLEATKSDGVWSFQKLNAQVDGGSEAIDLLISQDAPGSF